jgi:photosystem II stability/assembly factor-like uncharacterized protein
MIRILFVLLFTCAIHHNGIAQKKTLPKSSTSPQCTPSQERLSSAALRSMMQEHSIMNDVLFKCAGPTIMSGRVVDLEVDPKDPTHFFVAYASGGLWVTYNNGTTFEPIFDNQPSITIGDFAVDWNNHEQIWVGTGESNSSRSSYSGTGIFRGEKMMLKKKNEEKEFWKWYPSGLSDSHHIGRILVDPKNSKVIYVAAMGHLYTTNTERGVFKTIDGGQTWVKTLFVAENTGAIDLIMDPMNPQELYCAMWQRERKAWNFSESGKNSGIYQSTNAGESWELISSATSGFPNGDGTGRIGLAMHHSSRGKFLYAFLDNQFRRAEEKKDEEKKKDLSRKDFKEMTKEEFLALDGSRLNRFLKENNFPEKYTATVISDEIKQGKITPQTLYEYLSDANADLFDTPVIGAEVYTYDFSSAHWTKTHDGFLDDVVYSYGYYFGLIRVSPIDPQRLYIAGVPLLTSNNGGREWKAINPDNVHSDHHALWINPDKPDHIINGSDGGIQISYDNGKTFVNCNTPPVGQFYAVAADEATPYNIYGGLQDNGVWVGPSDNTPNRDWYQSGKYPFEFLYGGDGMQVQVDTRDNETIYTGSQFGYYSRLKRGKGEELNIHPMHNLGEKSLRWNWQTPILLSKYNQDIFYICSNKVHRSMNKGENFETLSGDLTKGAKAGDVPYGTLTCIAESPVQFGILAVGSDDGLVHISKDAGQNWMNISGGLPSDFWVSRIVFSSHKKERMYIALNGYRWDNMSALIYVTENDGKNWACLSALLPQSPVNVVREDPTDENILYAGTDDGLYITFNRGISWEVLGGSDFPGVAVHDMVIQEREKDLIVGTHGRSIWIGDLEAIQQYSQLKDKPVALLNLPAIQHSKNWGNNWSKWLTTSEPAFYIPYLVGDSSNEIKIEIYTEDSMLVASFDQLNVPKGLRFYKWNLDIEGKVAEELERRVNDKAKEEKEKIRIKKADNEKYYLPAGKYFIKVISGSHTDSKEWILQ